jgi:hypothetical protein
MRYAIANEANKYLSLYGWRDQAQAALLFRTKEDAEQHATTLPQKGLSVVPVIEAVPGAPPDGTTRIFGIKAKENV